jgi:hypothetical protein
LRPFFIHPPTFFLALVIFHRPERFVSVSGMIRHVHIGNDIVTLEGFEPTERPSEIEGDLELVLRVGASGKDSVVELWGRLPDGQPVRFELPLSNWLWATRTIYSEASGEAEQLPHHVRKVYSIENGKIVQRRIVSA